MRNLARLFAQKSAQCRKKWQNVSDGKPVLTNGKGATFGKGAKNRPNFFPCGKKNSGESTQAMIKFLAFWLALGIEDGATQSFSHLQSGSSSDQSMQCASSMDQFMQCMEPLCPLTSDNFFTPTSSAYVDFATGFYSRIDRHPAAVFFAQSEADVVNALKCAIQSGVQPVPRGGGHSYEGLSSMDNSLVIDLASMNDVRIISRDEKRGTAVASVQGGARTGHVWQEIDAQGGYTFNLGMYPSVGIGGFISGGGYGMIARYYGLAADQTVGLRVVLYNGTTLEATAQSTSDLYWALRGGGAGSFGIITEFRINLRKLPESTVFKIGYTEDAIFNVLRAWMDYFPTADSRLTTQLTFHKGGFNLKGQFLGPLWELNGLLNQSGVLSAVGIKRQHLTDKCTSLGTRAYFMGKGCDKLGALNTPVHLGRDDKLYDKIKSGYASKKLSDDGIRVLIDQLKHIPLSGWIQFQAYGGVFSTQPVSLTPWAGRDAVFSIQASAPGKKGDPFDAPNFQWLRGFMSAVAPHLNGRAYQNYCDLEHGSSFGEVYWGKENFERLKRVKAVYDPFNYFRSAQSVPLP
eukprot:g70517.t1